jgi:hypothetical protein
MVQAANFWTLHDLAGQGVLDGPDVGCVLVEREVRASPMIVADVAGQDATQVSLPEDEDMIQALAPDRADAPLREGILPRAVRRGKDFLDTHPLHAVPKLLAVDLVVVAEEIGRGGVVGEGVDDLLSSPVGGGMLGDVEVYDPSAMVSEHDKNEEHAQACSGNGEEVEGDEVSHMVVEERPPGLRRPGRPLRHEPRDGALGHVDTELEELAMDARGALERIRRGHSADQGFDLGVDGPATASRPGGELGPIRTEAAPLPPQDGVRSHDHQRPPPSGPDSGEPDPEEPISSA